MRKSRLQIVTIWRRILMRRNQRKLQLKRLLENQVKNHLVERKRDLKFLTNRKKNQRRRMKMKKGGR